MRILSILIFQIFLFSFYSVAQDKCNAKFGDITAKNFSTAAYSLDSNASAVVIADIGSSKIEGNNKGWFSLVYKRYRRIHIINKNGYDVANIAIGLYADSEDEEKLDRIKAVTYNLENGKVVETKLDVKANVFKDKVGKNRIVRKFALPNVKEGSIIEYEYSIVSDFLFNLQPWEFQGAYPVLWSEYNLASPSFFNYVFISQGSQNYDLRDVKSRRDVFTINDPKSSYKDDGHILDAVVTDNKWVKKNVPALKEESHTSTTRNHISKIEFQLSEQLEPLVYQNFLGSWPKLSESLMKADYFGTQLLRDNDWLKDVLAPIIKDVTSELERAQKIFAYVRDNFSCTNYSDLYLGQTLKNLSKTKSGTVSEINLLLTAMLKFDGIKADPVILSTRNHGYTYSLYPIIGKFNYVVVRISVNNKLIFLDATEPRIGFGYLPLRCYNGHARIINANAESVDFKNDNIIETNTSTIFISNGGKGKMQGTMQQSPGYYTSQGLRNSIKEKGDKHFQAEIAKSLGSEATVSNLKIDSIDKYESGLNIQYDFAFNPAQDDIIYLNPLLGEEIKENPFKSVNRLYPVEMSNGIDETFNMQLEIPEGYVVEELPQSLLLKLNQSGEGSFDYKISQAAGIVSFRCRLLIRRTVFQPNEYNMLREFYSQVVKKQSEQIVFKKKK